MRRHSVGLRVVGCTLVDGTVELDVVNEGVLGLIVVGCTLVDGTVELDVVNEGVLGLRVVGCTLVDGTGELDVVNEGVFVWEADVLGDEEDNIKTKRKVR